MTRLFERAVIAGVGLIGGSLALAAKRAGLIGEIVGLGRRRENLDVALQRGLVDRVSQNPAEAARDADFALLAVPVGSMAQVAKAMAASLAPGAVVSDVGSVKARVVRDVSASLPSTFHFVGAHPIAGTEDSGAAAAREDLFHGSRCIITPSLGTDAGALAKVEALWRAVGATTERMTPERHDEVLAWVSHVPHMLAFALMNAAPAETHEYAGPSFRGMTRVAGSPVDMWCDIAEANRHAIGSGLDAVMARLRALRLAIAGGDSEAVAAILRAAHDARRRMPEPK